MSLAALAATAVAAVAPAPAGPIVVDGEPISRGTLRHWAEVAGRSAGAPVPEPVGPTERAQAAGLLISLRWMREEARERGVLVTREEVTAAFREQRREAFPRSEDYRAFLRDTGQTTGNVRSRVWLGLQSDRFRAEVIAGIEEPAAQQKALDRFVAAYRRKWRARTACRAPWVDESSCGRIIRRG